MRKLRPLFMLLLIFTVCICVFGACGKKDASEVSDITKVELRGKNDNMKVRIEAEFSDKTLEEYKGKKVYLIARSSTSAGDSYTPVESAKLKSKLKFTVPFKTDGEDHLNTAFVCAIIEGEGDAQKFIPITNEKYIADVSELGRNVSRPATSSVKGIATDNFGHASYLGAEHILLEVRIDEILLDGYKPNAKSIVSQGLTYYFDGEKIEYYDKKIKEATDMGVRVYLQFVLGEPDRNDKNANKRIDCLYFPQSSSKASAFMPNMSDKKARGYIRALFDMFASRYSGGEFGVAIDYIIGKNVNDRTTWNNSGSAAIGDADGYYVSLVRLAHNSLVSHASNGCVYISLDNAWRASSGGALAYLNAFNTRVKATGNFGWNIALSYGNINSDTAWASSSEYSETLTADNLSELSVLLDTEDFMYKTSRRRAIISSFGLKRNSESQNGDIRRAASYEYLYYATVRADCIDALIYSYYRNDSFGLLTDAGASTALEDAFAICGSNRIGELSSLDSLIGDKWKSLKDSGALGKPRVYYSAPTSGVNTANPKRMFNFASGNDYGFAALGGADFCSLCEYTAEDGSFGKYLLSNGSSGGWRVLFCKNADSTELRKSKYLGITLNTEFSGEDFILIISGISKKTKENISFCARAQASGTPGEYIFDISDFADKLSSSDISISICTPQTETNSSGALSIYKVSLYGASGGQVWKYIIVTIIIIAVSIALFVLVKILNKVGKNKKKKSSKPHKKSGPEKRSKSHGDDDIELTGTDEIDDDETDIDPTDDPDDSTEDEE